MKKYTLLLPVCCLCLALGACKKDVNQVVVAGSTSVQPYMEILAEEFMRENKGAEIFVQGGGSAAGIAAAENKTADLGMSSRNLNEDEEYLWSVEIAKDGLALIVNPQNPVRDITLENIRAIYSLEITDWQQIGGKPAKIHIVTREEGSGTRSAFESLIMGETEITGRAIVQDSNGAVRQIVSSDPDAIGFISLGLVDKTVIALKLQGIEATRANVINGSYQLYRPFLLVADQAPAGEVKLFVDYILSAPGQGLLAAEGLIPREEATDEK